MFAMGKPKPAHVTDLLSAYIDNQLNHRERERVEAHVHQCTICAEDLRSLQATVQALRDLPPVPLPRSFVLQPVIQPRRAQPLELFLRLATVATALTLFLSIGGEMIQPVLAPAPEAPLAQALPIPEKTIMPAAKAVLEEPSPLSAGTPKGGATMAPTREAKVGIAAVPKTPVTPLVQAAPVPLAPSPTDIERAAASATVQPKIVVVDVTPTPVLAPPMVMGLEPTATIGQAAPDTTLPIVTSPSSTLRKLPLRAIQIALASLLTVLIGATTIVSRRR